ncbi:MAG: hypothetical protein ACREEP_01870 [Dongiaceae bacterium]
MIGNHIWGILRWACRHVLAAWAIIFVTAIVIRAVFGMNDHVTTAIGFLAIAPFMVVSDMTDPLEQTMGEKVAGSVAIAIIAGIYVALDALIWAFIRSARRGATLNSNSGDSGGTNFRHLFDRVSYWIARHWFPAWAAVASASVLAIFHLHLGYGAAGFHATILYLGTYVSFPLLLVISSLERAGINVDRAEVLHLVLISFFIICILADIAIKRYFRSQSAKAP